WQSNEISTVLGNCPMLDQLSGESWVTVFPSSPPIRVKPAETVYLKASNVTAGVDLSLGPANSQLTVTEADDNGSHSASSSPLKRKTSDTQTSRDVDVAHKR